MFDDSQYPYNTREINPKEHANIFSILTFAFTWDTIKKGYREEITEENIYRTLRKHDSNVLADKLEEEWQKQSKDKEPTVFRILLKVFGRQYLVFGLIQLLFKTPTTILRTIVLQKILVYYGKNNQNITQKDALYYGLGFILCTIILTVYTHTYLLCLQEMGLKIRVALCSLIYRKCLQLRSSKIAEISSGKTVTLVSKDVREFENFLITLQDASVGIIHIFVFTYLMYIYVGIAALISVAIMMMFMPFQLCLSRATTSRRLKTAAQTDRRLRIVQEVLSSIRMIKMYTWETYFAKITNKYRT